MSVLIDQELQQRLGKVAVLYGGSSAEREISLQSGAAVLAALQAEGVDAEGVDLRDVSLDSLSVSGYERVFIMLHGPGGEDGTVQGGLELLGLPYTGSGVLASALAMDKLRCKQFWVGVGLPTPDFAVLTEQTDWQQVSDDLGGVIMVKPALEGSSIGMSRVTDAHELKEAYNTATKYGDLVLAESWVEGPEYTVGVVNGEVLPAVRLETENAFYDYEAKYEANDTQYLCPCGLTDDEGKAIADFGFRSFRVCRLSGLGTS